MTTDSTGLIGQLPDPAAYVLATTIFLGRVCTVTLAATLAARTQRRLFWEQRGHVAETIPADAAVLVIDDDAQLVQSFATLQKD